MRGTTLCVCVCVLYIYKNSLSRRFHMELTKLCLHGTVGDVNALKYMYFWKVFVHQHNVGMT